MTREEEEEEEEAVSFSQSTRIDSPLNPKRNKTENNLPCTTLKHNRFSSVFFLFLHSSQESFRVRKERKKERKNKAKLTQNEEEDPKKILVREKFSSARPPSLCPASSSSSSQTLSLTLEKKFEDA